MNYGKVFLGVLAGVAAGAVLGILFAPDKGASTRNKISKKSKKYVDEVGAKYHEAVNGITTKFNTLKEEATHLFENGKQKAKEVEAKMNAGVK